MLFRSQLFKTVGLTERYERVKAGEPEEKVLEEAQKYYEARKAKQ